MTAACCNKEQKEPVPIHELVSVQQGLLPHKEVKYLKQGFSGGPVVKNLPSNARNEGLIPGGGTKTPQATGHLSFQVTTIEPGSQI